jgi:hypothetical protein
MTLLLPEGMRMVVPNDRLLVFKFSGSYSFSFGLTTGISFILQSGTPLSELAETYLGPRNSGMMFITPRGSSGRTPTIWDLGARFTYELPIVNLFHSRLILDLFHIASQLEPVDVDQLHYFSVDENGIPSEPILMDKLIDISNNVDAVGNEVNFKSKKKDNSTKIFSNFTIFVFL